MINRSGIKINVIIMVKGCVGVRKLVINKYK